MPLCRTIRHPPRRPGHPTGKAASTGLVPAARSHSAKSSPEGRHSWRRSRRAFGWCGWVLLCPTTSAGSGTQTRKRRSNAPSSTRSRTSRKRQASTTSSANYFDRPPQPNAGSERRACFRSRRQARSKQPRVPTAAVRSTKERRVRGHRDVAKDQRHDVAPILRRRRAALGTDPLLRRTEVRKTIQLSHRSRLSSRRFSRARLATDPESASGSRFSVRPAVEGYLHLSLPRRLRGHMTHIDIVALCARIVDT